MKQAQIIVSACMATLSLVAGAQAKTAIKPPKVPHVNQPPDDLTDAELAKLPKLKAPKDFDDAIAALQQGTQAERMEVLRRKVKRDLIHFPAGSFMMGDFGRLWSPSKLYYYDFKDDKPAHTVKLSAFSMTKYKVTFAEYDVFAQATGRPLPASSGEEADVFRHPTAAVLATWPDAQAYCHWLGKLLNNTMSLPTEAEWEYAARSGGQYFVVATNNGHYEYFRNIPSRTYADQVKPAGREDFLGFSAGYFPPNPAGLHQMYLNGTEWTQDWYDPDYYAKSPRQDPRGPETGTFKSIRGQYGFGSSDVGFTFARGSAPPDERADIQARASDGVARERPYQYSQAYTHAIRCVARP